MKKYFWVIVTMLYLFSVLVFTLVYNNAEEAIQYTIIKSIFLSIFPVLYPVYKKLSQNETAGK